MRFIKITAVTVATVAMLIISAGCDTADETVSVDSFAAKQHDTVSFSETSRTVPETASFSEPVVKSESTVAADGGYDGIDEIIGSYQTVVNGKRFYACFHEIKNGKASFSIGCMVDGEYFAFETEEIVAEIKNGKIDFVWIDNWKSKGNGTVDLSKAPASIGLAVAQTVPSSLTDDILTTDGNMVTLTK